MTDADNQAQSGAFMDMENVTLLTRDQLLGLNLQLGAVPPFQPPPGDFTQWYKMGVPIGRRQRHACLRVTVARQMVMSYPYQHHSEDWQTVAADICGY